MILRSLSFYLVVYIWTIIYFIVFSPVKFFRRRVAVKLSVIWTSSIIWCAKKILGIDYIVEGKKNIPKDKPFLVTSNHQSAWETFFFVVLFNDPAFVLKKELKYIPVLSSYFSKLGYIYIDREKGFSSLRKIIDSISKLVKKDVKAFIIFPQGTRVLPGEKQKLNSGVIAVNKILKIPILPIKHNSGLYWKNKKFIKNKGVIKVKVHPLLKDNLSKVELMKSIEKIFY
tara:strand:+ start:987 stop:1670 length:684 start_codon:yes stop_codon:yes gene_type:complete